MTILHEFDDTNSNSEQKFDDDDCVDEDGMEKYVRQLIDQVMNRSCYLKKIVPSDLCCVDSGGVVHNADQIW